MSLYADRPFCLIALKDGRQVEGRVIEGVEEQVLALESKEGILLISSPAGIVVYHGNAEVVFYPAEIVESVVNKASLN